MVKKTFVPLFFFSLMSLNLLGCIKTRLNIKTPNSSPQKNPIQEMANLRSNWNETQENFRKLNGRIEDLEKKIQEKEKEQSKTQDEKDLALALVQEQLKTHLEALKKLQKEIRKIKKRIYKKRSLKKKIKNKKQP